VQSFLNFLAETQIFYLNRNLVGNSLRNKEIKERHIIVHDIKSNDSFKADRLEGIKDNKKRKQDPSK
jgi:hypothetical protein